MEISDNFKGIFFVEKLANRSNFLEISRNFRSVFKNPLSFHLSKIYGNVKGGLEGWRFMECFNVPHNPERCEYPENNLKKEHFLRANYFTLYIESGTSRLDRIDCEPMYSKVNLTHEWEKKITNALFQFYPIYSNPIW